MLVDNTTKNEQIFGSFLVGSFTFSDWKSGEIRSKKYTCDGD